MYYDLSFELAVDGVKVSRIMIVVVHGDHDPVEGADTRHAGIFLPKAG
jgi:hypothetical protein